VLRSVLPVSSTSHLTLLLKMVNSIRYRNPGKIAADNSSGMEPSTPGKPNAVSVFFVLFCYRRIIVFVGS